MLNRNEAGLWAGRSSVKIFTKKQKPLFFLLDRCFLRSKTNSTKQYFNEFRSQHRQFDHFIIVIFRFMKRTSLILTFLSHQMNDPNNNNSRLYWFSIALRYEFPHQNDIKCYLFTDRLPFEIRYDNQKRRNWKEMQFYAVQL